jgi:hypothetical protein
MADSGIPGADVVGGVLGLGETVVGLINSGKAKREAARLQGLRPKFKESPYYKDALSLAESELSTGMSAGAQTAYEQGADRDLSTSLNAILQGGGSVNNVAQVFDQSQQGRQRLAMMKENLRLNQINNVVQAQQLREDQREKAFQFNEWAPWADQAQAAAEARKNASNMIWHGIDTAGSAVMNIFGRKEGQRQLDQATSSSAMYSDSPILKPSTVQQPGRTSYNDPGDSTPFINPNAVSSLQMSY